MRRTESAAARRPLAEVRLTRGVALQWLATAVVTFFASAYCFGAVRATARGESFEPIVITSAAPSPGFVFGSVVLVALVVVCHELLHGVFMARYGGSPTYGLGVSYVVLPYAYAGTEDATFTRGQLLAILLAPFVAITAAGVLAVFVVPAIGSVLIVPLAANAAGSIGDLWMAATLVQYPSTVRVAELEDGGQGFAIYADSDGGDGDANDGDGDARTTPTTSATESTERRPLPALLVTAGIGAVGTLGVLVGVGIVGVLGSMAFGSGSVVIGDPSGRWLLFRHELRTDGAAVLEVGTSLVLFAMSLGGVIWAGLAATRETVG